jgi:two-component system chemotaxis response regulator CheY
MSYSIMVVDDSSIIRTAIKKTIDMTGIPVDRIVVAEDGIDALEKLKDDWVDIIFCDIHMPKMDGVQLVEELRKSVEFKNIPFVVVSSIGSEAQIEELRAKGITSFIRKPFKPEDINEVMGQVFGEWEE